MKRFLVGLIVGMCVALPVSAIADSMMGKQVDMIAPVKLDGEYLDVNAIGIKGTTYAPVRALSEALGKDVDWQDGEVIIKTTVEIESPIESPNAVETEGESMEPQTELGPKQKLDWIEAQLIHLETHIHMRESQLGRHEKGRQLLTDDEIEQFRQEIEDSKARIEQLKQEQKELQDMLTE